MEFFKRNRVYTILLGVAVALVPFYIFVVSPQAAEATKLRNLAVDQRANIQQYLDQGETMPSQRGVEAAAQFREKLQGRFRDDLGYLKTQNANLYKLFAEDPRTFVLLYPGMCQTLIEGIGRTCEVTAKALQFEEFSGGAMPTNEKMLEAQIRYRILEEVSRIIQQSAGSAGIRRLEAVRFGAMPELALGGEDEGGGEEELKSQVRLMLFQQGMDPMQIFFIMQSDLWKGYITAQMAAPKKEVVTELPVLRHGFNFRVQMDPMGIPVLVNNILASPYLIHIMKMSALRAESGLVTLGVECDLLDFSKVE